VVTTDPLTYLRATHTAVQAEAEAATPGPWFANEQTDYDCGFEATVGTGTGVGLEDATDVVGHGFEGGGVHKLADATHIARHDPAAVLHRITADRKVIALHDMAHECSSTDWISREHDPCCWIPESETCDTIRALAEGWGWTGEPT
jgi:hypothetical protein